MTQSPTIDLARLAERTRNMIATGRTDAARPLLDALRRLASSAQHDTILARCDGSDAIDLDDMEARLLAREGRTADALALLERRDDTTQGRAAAGRGVVGRLLYRAELRISLDDALHAADDAAAAVIAAPTHAPAKVMLGVALLRLGRGEDARACIAEAVRAVDDHPGYQAALAQAEEACGAGDAAAATQDTALLRWPANHALRLGAIMTAMRARDFSRAVRLAEAARDGGWADASVFGVLGHALSSLGRHDEASTAYAEALKLAPEDQYVRHLVAASGVRPAADRAPADYVASVFDGYAPRFERHLIDLGYRVPGLVRRLVADAIGRTDGAGGARLEDVLDLGCGTGFVGVALSDLPIGRLVGVDISEQMLARAREKAIYAELVHADIMTMLADDACHAHRPRTGDTSRDDASPGWDLIIAADVLIYFGDLVPIFALIAARLRPDGFCIASLETGAAEGMDAAGGSGWRLHRQGRYWHTTAHLHGAAAAAGLTVASIADEVQRFEGGAPVDGVLVVLRRTGPST